MYDTSIAHIYEKIKMFFKLIKNEKNGYRIRQSDLNVMCHFWGIILHFTPCYRRIFDDVHPHFVQFPLIFSKPSPLFKKTKKRLLQIDAKAFDKVKIPFFGF